MLINPTREIIKALWNLLNPSRIEYHNIEEKVKVFSNLNGEIVALCPEEDIKWEIEDMEYITVK